jgi:hypothetical protein
VIGLAGLAGRRGQERGTDRLEGAGARCRIGLVVALAVIALGAGSPAPLAWACGASQRPEGPLEQVFELRIEGGEVADDMRTLRVSEGDDVRLRWTADAPVTLHLHGYDIEKEVAPGGVTEFAFETYATGRFPVEIHAPEQSHHEAPVVVLEVYPR